MKRQEIITDIVLTEHELQQHMRLMRGLASNNHRPAPRTRGSTARDVMRSGPSIPHEGMPQCKREVRA